MRLLFSLILLAVTVSAETPVGFNKWHVSDSTFRKRLGTGDPRNYQKQDLSWAKINNNFVAEGDSVLRIDEAVLKSRVNKNGESSVILNWNGQDYVVSQKLLGIGWLKISTKGRQWIDNTMDYSNVSTDSNIVTWMGISPGVDYRVRKSNGSVAHGIFFKPGFLDSAVALYNQRTDSLDIALANVMVYTLSQNIDNADSAMGVLNKRQLKKFAKHTFELTKQRLRYTGSDNIGVQPIPIEQFWRKRNDSLFCIEYVMMSDVKAVHTAQPNIVIWHNDVTKIEGTTNVEDAMNLSGSPTNNYGASTSWSTATDRFVLIRVQNVASELGAGVTEITSAVCSTNNANNVSDGDVSAYVVWKPWEEGTQAAAICSSPGCSFQDWGCTTNEWGISGADSTDDAGSDNSDDQDNVDRRATAEDTETVDATGWYQWDISHHFGDDDSSGNSTKNGINADNKRCTKFTLMGDCAIDSIYLNAKTGGGGSAGDNWKGLIYSDNAGAPDELLATSNEGPIDGTLQWQGIDFSSPVTLTAGTYWVGIHHNTKIDCYFQGAGTDQTANNADTYSDGPADPFGTPSYTDNQMAVYMTTTTAIAAQGWYDGDKNEEGIALLAAGGQNVFTSTEGASNQPFWVFVYTVSGDGEPATGRRRRILMGNKDTNDIEYARTEK